MIAAFTTLAFSALVIIVSLAVIAYVEIVDRQRANAIAITPVVSEPCYCDDCYWQDCYEEALSEFDALFNSYEIKRAKNNALMIRRGNSGPYRFAKRG